MLLHLASSCFILLHLDSCCFMLLHVASCCFILIHLASSCFILLHLTSSYLYVCPGLRDPLVLWCIITLGSIVVLLSMRDNYSSMAGDFCCKVVTGQLRAPRVWVPVVCQQYIGIDSPMWLYHLQKIVRSESLSVLFGVCFPTGYSGSPIAFLSTCSF